MNHLVKSLIEHIIEPNILNEVGEGNINPFKWTSKESVESFIKNLSDKRPEFGEGTLKYNFKSDLAEYETNIFTTLVPNNYKKDKNKVYISVGFSVKDESDDITNYNEPYKVLSTVLDIVINFVNTVNKIPNTIVEQIQFYPKNDGDILSQFNNSNTDSKRGRIYKQYIEKNINKIDGKYDLQQYENSFKLIRDDEQIDTEYSFIKENNTQVWDLKKSIVYLSKYMLSNGLSIKPLPKIKFIKNDKENSKNILGKTAYYDPQEKSITLYTLGRHDKDILRSFSHEMIHHFQNLEGRLNNIGTTNTNEDGDLPELEKEAYEKGNMMLRNWEDSIKNK